MSHQPPPTPWISSRFADESLLLDAQPIFGDGDVTLGDERDESEWSGSTSTPRAPRAGVRASDVFSSSPALVEMKQAEREEGVNRMANNMSLDLGDYLPEEEEEEEEVGGHGETGEPVFVNEQERRKESSLSGKSSSPTTTTSHKREGSLSLLSNSGPSKKTKPPTVPSPSRDDYIGPQPSSTRRGSSSSLSPILPPALLPQTISQYKPSLVASGPSQNAVAGPSRETASMRLKQNLKRTDAALRGPPHSRANVQTHESSSRIPTAKRRGLKRSALARYLAKPSALGPATLQSAVDPQSVLASPVSVQSGNSPDVTMTSPKDDVQLVLEPETSKPSYQHRSTSVLSLSSAASETSLAISDNSTHSLPSLIDNTPKARRESMSEKVIGFFSNMLRSSVSSESLARSKTPDAEVERDEGEQQDNDGEGGEVLEAENGYHESGETTNGFSGSDHRADRIVEITRSTTTADLLSRQPHMQPITKPVPFSRQLHVCAERHPVSKATTDQAKAGRYQVPNATRARPADSAKVAGPILQPRMPLQPTRSHNIPSSMSTTDASRPPRGRESTAHPRKAPVPSVKARPLPSTTSAFARAALARLPSPGKGATPSSQPTKILEVERAANLADRKNVFERLASSSSSSHSHDQAHNVKPASKGHTGGMRKTVPVSGRTPGKASTLRAAQRAKFDAVVKEKIEAKERQLEEERLRSEMMEEEEYARRRKETVIWAKPVPAMYHRDAQDEDAETA